MLKPKIYITLIYLSAVFTFAFAQTSEFFPFIGKVKENDINVRADSTVGSTVICRVNERDRFEVAGQLYDWYKIRLPKSAPAYIRKDMIELVDSQTGKVTKDNVNIRLLPSETAIIIGKAESGEAVNIVEFRKDWYKIQPVQNSYGWIHKNFVERGPVIAQEMPILAGQQQTAVTQAKITPSLVQESVALEGILKSYGRVFRRQATHKITNEKDKKLYLLKGNTAILNSLTRLRVKVAGRIVSPPNAKFPLVEVDKIEVLN